MIKAVFFDVDGTLITKGQRISPKTFKAIQWLRHQGIFCGIATGRSLQSISHFQPYFDFIISFNGQLIWHNNKIIYQRALLPKDILTIKEFARKENKKIFFGTLNHNEVKLLTHVPDSVMNLGYNMIFKLLNYKTVRNIVFKQYINSKMPLEPIYQCIVYVPYHKIKKIEPKLIDASFTYSNPYTVDVISKGNSKLKGIETIGSKYGFNLEEVMAFGDGINDIEMIKGVGIGVAMGNAHEDLIQYSDYITDSNESEGIYKALRHFELVPKIK